MKISVNDEELFTLNETKKKVICNDIPVDVFETDMKRRLAYILAHKYEQCFKRLKEEWVDSGKLASLGIESIPTNPDALAELIFSQPTYKGRAQKMRDELSIQDVDIESQMVSHANMIHSQLLSELAKL